jgi:two-component sensor histidine kinase
LKRVIAGDSIPPYETRRVRKDGVEIDVSISVSAVKDALGQITGAATIVRDITAQKRTERELRRKQAEVEHLNMRLKRAMRETHHRVKNNLQIISAMIDMQSIEHRGSHTVPIEELARLGRHIRTLAIVHDLLTRDIREDEQDQRVSSRSVINLLLDLLAPATGSQMIDSEIDDVDLLSKQAVTLSLVINELVSNAVKHASGRVAVSFKAADGRAEVQVLDDGPGLPEGFDPISHSHFGLELVQATVAADLNGQCYFETRPQGGAVVTISFPLPDDAPL